MRRRCWHGARAATPLCAVLLIACRGQVPSGQLPPGQLPPAVTSTPLCAASDPAQVVVPQRIALLTSTQLINMIRLVSDDAAQAVVDSYVFPVVSDVTVTAEVCVFARLTSKAPVLSAEMLLAFVCNPPKAGVPS